MRIDNSSQVPNVFGNTSTKNTSVNQNTGNTDTSYYSADKFKSTSDVSSEFDKALSKISGMIGGGNVLADNKTTATTQTTTNKTTANVSQQEINWALELETKVKGGHQPTTEETAKYQDIANRLASTQVKNEVPSTVTEQEINWALQIEEKVKTGYKPSQEETNKYQDIANRLKTGNVQQKTDTNNTPKVTEQEINWALELETKVKGGQQPTAEETAKYQDIANRLQNMSKNNTANVGNKDWATWSQPFTVPRNLFETTPQVIQVPATLRVMSPTNSLPSYTTVNVGPNLNTLPTTQNSNVTQKTNTSSNSPVSQQEINWALQLEEKVKTGYQPNSSEVYQYEDIANRLKVTQASNTQKTANTNTTTPNTNQVNTNNQTTQPEKKSLLDRMKSAWNALVG